MKWSSVSANNNNNFRRLCALGLVLMLGIGFAAQVPYRADKIAKAIGWVPAPQSDSLCGGYYQDPLLQMEKLGLIGQYDSQISADQVTLQSGGQSVLRGNVLIQTPNRVLRADQARFVRNAKSQQIETVSLHGHIALRQPGRLWLANKAKLNLKQHTGQLDDVVYRLALRDAHEQDGDAMHWLGLNAWGQAKTVTQLSEDEYELQQGSYATCPPSKRDWQLSAKKIHYNKKTKTLKAYSTVFRIRNVPVAYLPYFRYHNDDSRQSGFLTPAVTFTSKSGVDIMLPYYWNIAPQTDLTISPELFSKRGVLLGLEWRYLSRYGTSILHGALMPYDRLFKQFRDQNPSIGSFGNARAYLTALNHTEITPNLQANIQVTGVTDDYYFQDFENDVAGTTDRQLLQTASLQYHGEHHDVFARMQHYQSLHPINQAAIADVYAMLPEARIYSHYDHLPAGFGWQNRAQIVNFHWPGQSVKVEGFRSLMAPTLNWRLSRPYGYWQNSIHLHASDYRLSQAVAQQNLSRLIPLISSDASLIFDRESQWFHLPVQQTLEPRVFYLYVPYQNQDSYPLFDTGLYNFTYDQLFRLNRFSGDDRIGDANQMAFALSSRVINMKTGLEWLQLHTGILRYFQNRRLAYCTGINCSEQMTASTIRYTSATDAWSPWVSQLQLNFNTYWQARGDLAYDFYAGQVNNASVDVHYQSDQQHILNFFYQYQRALITTSGTGQSTLESANTIGSSGAWPLNKHWSLLGTFSYNLAYNHSQSYFVGTQYNSCCFALRVIGGRSLTSVSNTLNPTYSTAVFFQILFKGLGNIASRDPSELLTTEIPGYRDVFRTL